MQATCETWGRCDDAELEIDLAKGKRPRNPCVHAGEEAIGREGMAVLSLGISEAARANNGCDEYNATDFGRDDSVDMSESGHWYEGSCHGDPRCVYWCNKSDNTWLDKQGVCKQHE